MQAVEPDDAARDRTEIFILAGLFLLILGILLVYSQTLSFTWDEGFHLLAAQLILHGKRPYLDFFLAQTPLYAYWNAFWMRLFGDTWRTAHTFSTLMTGGAVWLTMQFIFSRFPRSRLASSGDDHRRSVGRLEFSVIEYGTLGQPYGVGLLAIVVAFRFTLAAVARPGWRESAGAGLFALTAAACSLLTAPVAPVCLLWILWKNRSGRPSVKSHRISRCGSHSASSSSMAVRSWSPASHFRRRQVSSLLPPGRMGRSDPS